MFITCAVWFAVFAPRDGVAYFTTAAQLDGLVILWCALLPDSRLVRAVSRVAGVFFVLNVAGFVLYSSYLPPLAYNLACWAAYAYLLHQIITDGGSNNGNKRRGRALVKRRGGLRCGIRPGMARPPNFQTKTRVKNR